MPVGMENRVYRKTVFLNLSLDLFWTYEQAVSYYKFTIIHYIGFHDKGMLLAGGCGDTNGKSQISKTNHLKEAYEFGKMIYQE